VEVVVVEEEEEEENEGEEEGEEEEEEEKEKEEEKEEEEEEKEEEEEEEKEEEEEEEKEEEEGDLALVNSKLTDVGLEEENVSALHERVENLGGSELVLEAAHDLAALLYPSEGRPPGNVQGLSPVLHCLVGDIVRAPDKLDPLHIHARRFPDLDEVLADNLDLFQVPPHLVIHQREPIGDPEDKRATSTATECVKHKRKIPKKITRGSLFQRK
jgi:flagellar biosynthesis GTPase FlhF